MDPKKILAPLQKLGLPIPPHTLALLVIGIPLLLALSVVLWKLWKKRRGSSPATVPVRASADAPLGPPSLRPRQLRRAWLRFVRSLPRIYRRSILNFEHFVVLGDAGAGKSRVIDTYTDWRRQQKQFVGSQAFDSDLQVYLGSQAVVTELPAKVLVEPGPKCQTALRRLWAPLYRARSPTVVVVVDMERLKTTPPDLIVDSAERIRGKVNLLSGIRKQPLDVRVVLTHLDSNQGWDSFSTFCRDEKIPLFIPLFIPLGSQPDRPPVEQQLAAWVDRARDHLARALVKQGSSRFREIIGFLRRAPEIPRPLARFVDTLFAPEALSLMPHPAGVYLGALPAAEPNPLVGDPGDSAPDPRLRHLLIATLLATATLAYLGTAFFVQRDLYHAATLALTDYKPSAVGSAGELKRRHAITSFAWRGRTPVERRPDFYQDARIAIRKAASERIRTNLLVPNLNKVAQTGALEERSLSLPWRRSLFYLALIHGDEHDGMRILDPERLHVWSRMTELPASIISDYLNITDLAERRPVEFEATAQGLDVHDGIAFWVAFLRDVERAANGEAISAHALAGLQARAADGLKALDRFEHDDIAASILKELDEAASLGPGHEPVQLEAAYRPRFAELLSDVQASDVFGQREQAREIFRAIRGAQIAEPQLTRVSALADRLISLYGAPIEPKAPIVLKIAGVDYKFDGKRWAELIRNSQGNELCAAFLGPRPGHSSIFFDPGGGDPRFRPLSWNPTNDGSSIFVGTAEIGPLFTSAAYETLVREPVTRLSSALDGASIPLQQRQALEEFVSAEVRRYAIEYKRQLRAYYDSFGLSTPSPEALRVAIAQMIAEQSPFAAFIRTVDGQIDVPAQGPMLEPMRKELSEFNNWRKLVDASSGAAEVEKYKAILAQLLLDLGPPSDSMPGAEGGPPIDAADRAPEEGLEAVLSRAGRLSLLNLRGEKGSYASLVTRWLASVQLPASQQSPFLWPVFELDRLGRRDIEQVVAQAWEQQIVPDLQRLQRKFPFDRESADDAEPREIDDFLNPATGRVFDLYRRYLKPLIEASADGSFRPREVLHGRVRFPATMLPALAAASALSARLYDAAGKPSPLALKVATVPFDHGIDPAMALTLVYLTVGEASVYNFNQKPGLTTIRFDWTREHISQVGIQFTNLDTQENVFPDPIATASSNWSVLRLLSVGKLSAVKQPAGGQMVVWDVRRQQGGQETTPARFIVVGNPTDLFSLGPAPQQLASRRVIE